MARTPIIPRRFLAGLFAALALAGAVGSAVVAPETAHADAICGTWRIPSAWMIQQNNGWQVAASTRTGSYQWFAYGIGGPYDRALNGTMNLTRFDVSGVGPRVEFTISWTNGAVGFYTGTIDPLGYLQGVTYDMHNLASVTGWHSMYRMTCG